MKLSNFSLGGDRPKDCRTSVYGCCWDAYTPRGDIYGIKGCPGKVTIQRDQKLRRNTTMKTANKSMNQERSRTQ